MNDINHVDWLFKAMKNDEAHEIDEEFDAELKLLDRMAPFIDGFQRL